MIGNRILKITERKKSKLKDDVDTYNEGCECESASTRGYVVHFGVQNYLKILKDEGFVLTISRFLPIKYGAILHIPLGYVDGTRPRGIFVLLAFYDGRSLTLSNRPLKQNLLKKENGGISQAGQRENRRFFRSLSR